MKIKWKKQPEDHDYPAAESYLALLFFDSEHYGKQLRQSKITEFKAKDIFRASKLPLLGISNSHVQKNIEKIHQGKKLSPLLLVRGYDSVIIADGYHRICAVYQFDEDALIPCKIV